MRSFICSYVVSFMLIFIYAINGVKYVYKDAPISSGII